MFVVVLPTLILAALAVPPLFVDSTIASDLDFRYETGASGELYFPEIMGGGAAFLDFDLDGDLDALLVQAQPLAPGQATRGHGDRLFRNDLGRDPRGRLRPRFVDVTPPVGLTLAGYGMGVAVGDYDRDGFPDLYLTRFGSDRLLRNLGDGRFADETSLLGAQVEGWSTSASFADFDGDGWLDLYVARYVEVSLARHPHCYAESTRKDYCGPSSFRPLPHRLLRNRSGSGFQDVSVPSGIAAAPQPGLGVIAGDFDGDGRTDFYVANDGQPNQLWLGQKDGTFRDDALLAGVALDREGKPQGSMGIDAGDFDRDGDLDLVVTNLTGEAHALYRQDGSGLFSEQSHETGLAAAALPFTGFGTAWLDADLDGALDLFIANGAVRLLEDRRQAGDPFPFGERNQLLVQRSGRFVEHREPSLEAVEVSRGVAVGDVDNDGDADLLVVNEEGPARLLLGTVSDASEPAGPRWLGLTSPPWGPELGRATFTQGSIRQLRVSHTDGSYLSASDPRLLFAGIEGDDVATVHLEGPGRPPRRWRGPARGRWLVAPSEGGRQ